MAEDQQPFADVVLTGDGFTLPSLKWRELVFIGAFRQDGDAWVRDPSRPMPPFQRAGLFPDGRAFDAVPEAGRVRIRFRP
jgi:hypothetical protein